MSIRARILTGVKKSRKKLFTQQDFDDFVTKHAMDDNLYNPWPTMHGVRARVSELTKEGQLIRTGPNTYTRGEQS